MREFFEAMQYPLIRDAVLAGLLASIACGVIGTFAVVRRITYVAGGIAHCVLGGIGAAIYLNKVHGWTTLNPPLGPLIGALAASLVAAAIIGWVSLRWKEREDTIISALWAIGMAVGVLLLGITPGYQQQLMSYLFGSILIVPASDLWLIAILDAVVVAVTILFYKQLLAVCFDEEFARTRGLRVEAYYFLLLGLMAVTVVLLVTVVGLILVIALLTLPVAVAGRMAGRLWHVMVVAALLSAAFTTAGMGLSFNQNLPSGAFIILLAGGVYLAMTVLLALRRRLRRIPAGEQEEEPGAKSA